jgi:hypothetical protein
MDIIRRIENGTTTVKDSTTVKRLGFFVFVVGISVGLLLLAAVLLLFGG